MKQFFAQIIEEVETDNYDVNFLRYEDLVQNKEDELERIAKFLFEIDWSAEYFGATSTFPAYQVTFKNNYLMTAILQGENGASAGIDLPVSLLVWKDLKSENKDVYVSYEDPNYLKVRHQLFGREKSFNVLAAFLSNITEYATKKPTSEPGMPPVGGNPPVPSRMFADDEAEINAEALTAMAKADYAKDQPVIGMRIAKSKFRYQETLKQFNQSLSRSGRDQIYAWSYDHGKTDIKIRPSTVIGCYFSDHLMMELIKRAPTTMLVMPQKYLIWEATDGTVYIGYNQPTWSIGRYSLNPNIIDGDLITRMQGSIRVVLSSLVEGQGGSPGMSGGGVFGIIVLVLAVVGGVVGFLWWKKKNDYSSL